MSKSVEVPYVIGDIVWWVDVRDCDRDRASRPLWKDPEAGGEDYVFAIVGPLEVEAVTSRKDRVAGLSVADPFNENESLTINADEAYPSLEEALRSLAPYHEVALK